MPKTPGKRKPRSAGAPKRSAVLLVMGTVAIRFSEGLATPVPDGAEIAILPAVSGG